MALYASDMPNGRRRHTSEQVRSWIVQGAERLGAEELRRRAEFFRGWRLLDMHGLVTAQIQARHEQRFPRPNRLINADKEAAGSVYGDGMTEEARLRNGHSAVDGDCPCRGTGGIAVWGADPDASYEILCPVHSRAQIDAFHRARRVAC
ncbi:hypothetical protein SHJG_6427 [Streptomyces hygroscopicus subsp. jinggangensis 5008]|nr:hypothetical protein SHJG_6427 [Streptomyces hygroscopicus subsp. jinggangensis 5008]AGF65851.1 hypothetical protein SHJGH_6188 [Streptomyces hygroscopicus subsp. jinggangensis TL01]